jgi:hypothetical protein
VPFSLRLRLDPVFTEPTETAPSRVGGLLLAFTTLGTTPTRSKRGEPLPATITFVGRMTASVRDKPAPQEAPLGELEGKLEVTAQRSVVFDCDTESLLKLTRQPERASENEADSEPLPRFAPRALALSFAPEFRGVEGLKEKTARLFLPQDAGKFRYLEVFAKIEVAGAVEAEFEQSDILDVLVVPDEPPAYPFSL